MIKTLRVQNYKSLKNQEIPLNALTVLVGPNAAGKSNILDCLAFIADVARDNLENAIHKRGGFDDLVWGGEKKRSISISFAGQLITEKGEAFEYSIKISGPTPIIAEESGSITDLEGTGLSFHRQDTTVKYKRQGATGKQEEGTSSVGSGVNSALGTWSEAAPLRESLISWFFYDFTPSQMRSPKPVFKQTRLLADGSNVATLLHWIYSEEPEIFRRVEELLKTAIPEVEQLFSLLTEDGKSYVAWRERDIPGRIRAWSMSEGSVRLVAMLLALLVPEPPPLVAFENPEIHLHPYLMEYLAGILKAGSQRSQVLITTHSPYLLNYLPLESLLIVEKKEGETKVEPVKDSEQLREALKRLGLGEIWYAGHLGGVP